MDRMKQFEAMALIRAYAALIVAETSTDQRPSTAEAYADRVKRMAEIVKQLDTKS